MKKPLKRKPIIFIDVFLLALLTASTFYLFYHQARCEGNGIHYPYYSDLLVHIDVALSGTSYSLAAFLFKIAYAIYPSYSSIAALLTLIVDLTAVGAGAIIAFLLQKQNCGKIEVTKYIPLGTLLLFISSIYVPRLLPWFYQGAIGTQPWHNSTYLVMRMFGLLAILMYLDIEKNYLERISIKDAALFTLLLFFVNYSKPNFIIAFAPVMLIFLIADFFHTKMQSFWQNVKFGSCVLISLPILFLQASLLYPNGGESGIAFTLSVLKTNVANPLFGLRVLCGLLFPLTVSILFYVKHIKTGKAFRMGWMMWLLCLMECIFLTETGPRASHGNFWWGLMFFSFFLFVACASEWIRANKEHYLNDKLYFIGWIPLTLSVLCGVVYFGILLRGSYYYI